MILQMADFLINRIITSIFLLILLSNNLYPQEIRFKHITSDNGLSQNFISAIMQDSKGFMWFGTKDGLNRYDGYSFVIYRHDPFDKTTISGNYISALFEDSRGYIWVGTMDGGLNFYDKKTEVFQKIKYNSILPDRTDRDEIKSIIEDREGNIWVGTRGEGVFRFTFKSKDLSEVIYKQFINDPDNPESLKSNVISNLYVDSKGALWVGADNGPNKFDDKNENFTAYNIQDINRLTKNLNITKKCSFYESKDGTFWLGTNYGLVLFNKKTNDYKLFPHNLTDGYRSIFNIVEDNSRKLWLATDSGLLRFDPSIKKYEYFKNDPFNSKSISFNNISSLYIDKTNILWVGTAGLGINFYDPKGDRFSTFTIKRDQNSVGRDFSVKAVLKDKSGLVWISGDVFYQWNPKTGKIISFARTPENKNAFGIESPFAMIQAASGMIWFADSEGLFRYNPVNKEIKHYKYDSANPKGLTNKEVFGVLEDNNGDIWIISENYFSKLTDAEKGYFEHFSYRTPLPYRQIIQVVLFQDSEGIFWIGTKNGLLRFDAQNKIFSTYKNDPRKQNSLGNDFVKSICADPKEPDKYLWIGTAGGGLNLFNKKNETFTYLTEKDGLPNNVVYGILPDQQGNLWLSTNRGLSKFNPNDKTFRNFDVNDGLQSNEFNTGAYYKSYDGEMFFGGIKGLNYFYPDKINANPFIPNVVFTNLKLEERNITNKSDYSILNKSIIEADTIILSYSVDVITFEFASLDFSAPEKNQYSYLLENFNKNWIFNGTNRHVTYTNLPSGKYLFRVKASNNDELWNEKAAAITLIIKPPWWNTWWAYVLYSSLILLGLYLIRRYELNRLNLKNQLKLEKVETDTLRNLDQLKSNFFANISHEFRTPLTLILGQIENVISTNIGDNQKSKLHVANRNAKRLLNLINQLLDLSKLEVGSMKLKAKQYNIVSFAKYLFYSFESIAENKKIVLKFESEYEIIPVVFEPDKMEKIFYNLISNALKFTPEEGEIKISIKTRDLKYAEIKIADTGIGIPEKLLENIFDRFYQVDNSITRAYEGTGIGLALTKELVELHKGNLTVNSKEGEGTQFIINLPLCDLKTEKEYVIEFADDSFAKDYTFEFSKIPLADSNSDVQEQITPNQQEIILIVEDNPDVRAFMREQLSNEYKIIEATNGNEGFYLAQNEIPDLIITDVMMPLKDGYQFTKEIRRDEKTSHIPIIMLTAKVGIDERIEGLESGIDSYIPKPFNAKELVATVKNLISQRLQLRKRFSSTTIIKPSEVSSDSVDRQFMKKVIQIIENHFEDDQFGVDKLASEINMSISQLNRKMNALIDQAPGYLIRSLRLQRAADYIKQNSGSIAEICYKVGFSDQAYFSRAFKKQFGCSPSEYKKANQNTSDSA